MWLGKGQRHVAQAGLELAIQIRLALNWQRLPWLPRAGVKGVDHHALWCFAFSLVFLKCVLMSVLSVLPVLGFVRDPVLTPVCEGIFFRVF